MQLLRTIAIIFIIYYGLRLLSRYVFPFLLKRWVNKKMGQFQNQTQNQFDNEKKAKDYVKQHEGEVKIKTKKNSKTETDGIGDFVDYEEVE
ncbi:MAG: DUF4834 family protein [Vicingus serpentipes]|nr:DUF4834 family protein [Vicingus serpentipes]